MIHELTAYGLYKCSDVVVAPEAFWVLLFSYAGLLPTCWKPCLACVCVTRQSKLIRLLGCDCTYSISRTCLEVCCEFASEKAPAVHLVVLGIFDLQP